MPTPQEMGRRWEEIWKRTIQGEAQPGSGNKWFAKLDVRSRKITWSCKWTSETGFRITPGLLLENKHATDAPGGNGSIAAFAIRLEGQGDYVVLKADDFIELMTQPPLLAADKAANRRKEASVPELLK